MARAALPLPLLKGINPLLPGLQIKLVDAEGQILGRLASKLALVLQGKDKPTYRPEVDMGDVVVVVNSEKIQLTGNKLKGMKYQWHTGYPGGLKERTVEEQLKRKPEMVLSKAVERMLPKNNLRTKRMAKLILKVGPEHGLPEEALTKWEMPVRGDGKSRKRTEKTGMTVADVPEGYVPSNWQSLEGYELPEEWDYYKKYPTGTPSDYIDFDAQDDE